MTLLRPGRNGASQAIRAAADPSQAIVLEEIGRYNLFHLGLVRDVVDTIRIMGLMGDNIEVTARNLLANLKVAMVYRGYC